MLDKDKVSLGENIDRISSDKRVALTRFEADPSICHRSKVSERISEITTASLKLIHL